VILNKIIVKSHSWNFERHPPRCQKIKWSIYCWLSLDIMAISYVTRQWFCQCLLFLQVSVQAIKVNW